MGTFRFRKEKICSCAGKKGGGSKEYMFDIDSSFDEVLSVFIKLYWPHDTTQKIRLFGHKTSINFNLADITGEIFKTNYDNKSH